MMRAITTVFLCIGGSVSAQCSLTPSAAVKAVFEKNAASVRDGYRATESVVDMQTGRMWIRVVTCNHPERPASLIPINVPVVALGPDVTHTVSSDRQPGATKPPSLAVRAGDLVLVRIASSGAHVELHGNAEEQGTVGQTIAVRMASLIGDTSQPPRHIKVVITGIGEAMVQP